MKIAIIGAGNVGGTLGTAWAKRGHAVVFGVRDPGEPKIRELVEGSGAGAARIADAVAGAGELRGKILVDATNPLTADNSALAIGHDTSGGEELARRAPAARVVKCFNTIGSMHMADPTFAGRRASMFLCGDDRAAKAPVAAL